jgi:hypothetical protein
MEADQGARDILREYSRSHRHTPSLLTTVQFEINTDQGTEPNTTVYYRDLEQIVVTLSSTCVTPEETIHGGGTCSSNLAPSSWDVHGVWAYTGSIPRTTHFDLPFDAPRISTRAVCVLALLALVAAFVNLVALMLTLGCSGKVEHKDGRPKTQVRIRRGLGVGGRVWLYVVLGAVGFVFLLAGTVLLRVQVSRTVAALKLVAEDARYSNILYTADNPIEEDSAKFWGVMWAAVVLMAVNPVMLALDGLGFCQWPL